MTRSQRRGLERESARFDRRAILDRTDLAQLADELIGGRQGNGRAAKWPSPVPGHPQTGKSPPMSVFRTRSGEERWTCFATGQSGSAIDLVMTVSGCEFPAAIEWLAGRSGVVRSTEVSAVASRRISDAVPGPQSDRAEGRRVHPRVGVYVSTCERLLWRPEGAGALDWLTSTRGLDPNVLDANRVGFDPGVEGFARPKGLPYLGPAVVFPVLDERAKAIYFQARYLNPNETGRKYHNPPEWMAPNPRVAWIHDADRSGAGTDWLVVTEGLPDALAVVGTGVRSIAVLGAASAGADVAASVARSEDRIVIIFDRDDAGRAGAQRLHDGLARLGRDATVIDVPAPYHDVNEWIADDRPSFVRSIEGDPCRTITWRTPAVTEHEMGLSR